MRRISAVSIVFLSLLTYLGTDTGSTPDSTYVRSLPAGMTEQDYALCVMREPFIADDLCDLLD